jgi:glycosyltransferase involved in cell wall biosynthesis
MSMEHKAPLSIIYLGRRGGGAKLTANISEDLGNSKKFSIMAICVRKDNELVEAYDQSKIVTLFNGLSSISTFSRIITYVFFPKKLLLDTRLSPVGVCLVPMISPLGLIVERLLKAQGVTVIRLLHDFERHPGDSWPPNLLIRRIIKKSEFLITLSAGVASKAKELNPNIRLSNYPHPAFNFPISKAQAIPPKKYILFIGRIRKYKGVENLIAAYSDLIPEDIDLVIAGEGKLEDKVEPNIRVINRWLEEYEIASLVQNAEVVVFPYIEASQSGILPYCVSQKKKVVVTPLPGLLEQIAGYENSFATKGFDVASLSYALNAAIGSKTFSTKTETQSTKNIEICLLESGIFTKK